MSVLAIASNFQKAFSKNSTTLEQKWLQPVPNFIKLNVDAAYFEDKGAGATIILLQDDQGKFLAAQYKLVPYAADVVTTEAMAMRDGLIFANSLGFPRVEAESDSLTVIDYCTGQTRCWDAAAAMIA